MGTNNLAQKAYLSSLIVSRFTGRKNDKTVSAAVDEQFKTKRKAGRYVKDLFDTAAMKNINGTYNTLTKYHRDVTLPWGDNGRIASAALHERVAAEMKVRIDAFLRAADEFTACFPSLLLDAKRELGSIFNENDYPPITQIRSKFGVNYSISPVPTEHDFRFNWSNEELERVKQEISERNRVLIAQSVNGAHKKLYDALNNMTERIFKPKFRDSLITDLGELVTVLGELNFSGDQNLEGIRQEITDKLLQYTPAEIRGDDAKREELNVAAGNIIRRLNIDID